jgi:uncharacterized protein (DUF488 family)
MRVFLCVGITFNIMCIDSILVSLIRRALYRSFSAAATARASRAHASHCRGADIASRADLSTVSASTQTSSVDGYCNGSDVVLMEKFVHRQLLTDLENYKSLLLQLQRHLTQASASSVFLSAFYVQLEYCGRRRYLCKRTDALRGHPVKKVFIIRSHVKLHVRTKTSGALLFMNLCGLNVINVYQPVEAADAEFSRTSLCMVQALSRH